MNITIYTYWKLAEPWQFKQLQNTALQELIDGANIWTATWLYNIVLSETLLLDPRSSKLETWSSRLETRRLWDARIESRASMIECQLTFERYCTFPKFYWWKGYLYGGIIVLLGPEFLPHRDLPDLNMKRKAKRILVVVLVVVVIVVMVVVVVVVAAAAAAAAAAVVVVKWLHHTNGLSKPSFSNFLQLRIQGTQ